MTDASRPHAPGLDFRCGAPRGRLDDAAAFRLADLRRSAARRAARGLEPRTPETRHVRWRGGVARLHPA